MNTASSGVTTAGLARFLGGGVLAASGLRRGATLGGLLMLAAGGYLAYRGYRAARCALGAGGCAPDRAKCQAILDNIGAGVNTGIYDQVAQRSKVQRFESDDEVTDLVDEASDDSFPCSDPPSFTPRSEATV